MPGTLMTYKLILTCSVLMLTLLLFSDFTRIPISFLLMLTTISILLDTLAPYATTYY